MARIGEGIETVEVVKPSLPTPVTLPSVAPAAPERGREVELPELVPVAGVTMTMGGVRPSCASGSAPRRGR
jgi:hypothetical protein